MKLELIELEEKLVKLQQKREDDMKRFLRFACDFIDNMGTNFLEISHENRIRCKQVVFPGGFYLDADKKVYTTEISPLITLAAKKKDAEASENSHLVRVTGQAFATLIGRRGAQSKLLRATSWPEPRGLSASLPLANLPATD
jgi:hypothetical protein